MRMALVCLTALVFALSIGNFMQGRAFKESCKNFDSLLVIDKGKDSIIAVKDSLLYRAGEAIKHHLSASDSLMETSKITMRLMSYWRHEAEDCAERYGDYSAQMDSLIDTLIALKPLVEKNRSGE